MAALRGQNAHEDAGRAGLAAWLIARLRTRGKRAKPRLELLERINLGPRQSLALIQAEGSRLLVATSAEGSPAFYRLHSRTGDADTGKKLPGRISW